MLKAFIYNLIQMENNLLIRCKPNSFLFLISDNSKGNQVHVLLHEPTKRLNSNSNLMFVCV